MTNMFDKWDKAFNTEGLAKDVAEASNNSSGSYEEVPHGDYEVAIERMELKASKKGDPMVSIWFRIVNGSYKGSIIFFNQVITQGFQIHIVNELLRMIVSEMGDAPAIEFKTEGFVLGVGAKMFTIAGPVIVYGVVASVVYGLIYWITTLF